MVNHIGGTKDLVMEMKNVEPWNPDPEKFEIPSDYQLMDMHGMMPDKQQDSNSEIFFYQLKQVKIFKLKKYNY